MNYFDRQFLRAQDFRDEQDYHIDRRRRHNTGFHSYGVVEGLEVVPDTGTRVNIQPGWAIDSQGREIVLAAPGHSVDTGGASVEIWISYPDPEPQSDPSTDPGVLGNTRIHEEPVVGFGTAVPADGVWLATVAAADPVTAGNINNGVRQFAGDDSVTSAMIAEADGTTQQDTNSGTGVKTDHIQDRAVTGDKIADDTIPEAKLTPATRGKLVTNGDSHAHGHSSLDLNDGTNPHGTTAADVGAVPETGGAISGNLGIDGMLSISNELRVNHVFSEPAGGTVSIHDRTRFHRPVRFDMTTFFAGTAIFQGGKQGYVTDIFVNGSGQVLHTGDLVKLKPSGVARFRGTNNRIPVPEVTFADNENDPMVIGIVDSEATPTPDEPDSRTEPEDPNSIRNGGELFGVTLGAYSHCKVDATEEPIEVGDLLTSSSNPGHAKKATDPKIGCIIGKALESLEAGIGYIAVFVNIQ